ncbi:MAG: DciA family protein [Leucobacter sp.]
MQSAGEKSFATDAYLRAKAVWRGAPVRRRRRVVSDGAEGKPFGWGRDPRALGDVLSTVATDMGWSVELEQARLLVEWPEFAGEATAEHTSVLGISNGVLQVQCDSTTWATELRRLRAEMLTRLLRDYPDAEIRDLRFLAPGAPSWRHGPRTVQGRGPRDTYG